MRGLKIASVLSILSSEDMPSTAPYGKLNLCLSKIQSSLKHDDSNLWLGVLPATIDGWIRKVENLGIQYRVEEVNGTYTGIDKSDFKGTDWNIQDFSDMARYILRIGHTILNAQDDKAKGQEKERMEKLKQSDRKRAAVQASLKSGKEHIKVY